MEEVEREDVGPGVDEVMRIWLLGAGPAPEQQAFMYRRGVLPSRGWLKNVLSGGSSERMRRAFG